MTAFDLTVDLLLKDNHEILVDSKLVTLNGRDAYIEMVDVVPYISSSELGTGASSKGRGWYKNARSAFCQYGWRYYCES